MSQPNSSDEFRTLLRRLDAVVDEEMKALEAGRRDRLVQTVAQKERILADFARVAPTQVATRGSLAVADEARRVMEKMQENLRRLSIQLKATGDVIDTISTAIAFSESDGTYERARRRA